LRLIELRLRNFRCYKDEISIRFDELTVLIGRNDSGKSTILDALDLFLNDGVPDNNDACKHGNQRDLAIIGIFGDLPSRIVLDQEAETTFEDECLVNAEGNLEIHKVFNGALEKPKLNVLKLVAFHPTAANFNDLVNLNNTELKKRADDVDADTAEIDKKVNAQLRGAIRRNADDLGNAIRDVSLLDGNGINFWKGIQAHLPALALFKADRASTDQDPEAQDPLNAAIKEAIKKRAAQLNEIQQFVEGEVKKVADLTLKGLQEMDATLAGSLKPECSVKPWASLFKVSITGDSEIPINKRGSGIRRLILLNFLRAKAEILKTDNRKQSLIYAIEEPETSQHPRSQRMLISVFQELACTEQIVITTHTPMLARTLPCETLRFVSVGADETREILTGGSDEINAVISRSLGVLPDHNVKLFIGVEGKTDIPFLKNMSKVMLAAGENVPNLEELELNGELIFVPFGGSALVLWSNRLRALNRPQFHIYDRDSIPPAEPKYRNAVDDVNARAGCRAVTTEKREIENYVHPDAVNLGLASMGINFAIRFAPGDFEDVPQLLVTGINAIVPDSDKWGESRAKEFLSNVAVRHMTKAMLDQIDPQSEVVGWFTQIREMIAGVERNL
jgi:putative ATP-dependent endonuclease of OLD family